MKYISHLDLNRCMIRAIRRSGLPAWYTEGFHPHLYLMFPLALSLGVESVCEIMDLRLTEERSPDEILNRLNYALPEGLHALAVRNPDMQAQEITGAEYLVCLSSPEIPDLSGIWHDFFSQPEIMIQKKTKKGMKEIEIKNQIIIHDICIRNQNLLLTLHLPAGNNGNLNVNIVTEAFQNYADKPVFTESVCRTKIFCRNQEEFL